MQDNVIKSFSLLSIITIIIKNAIIIDLSTEKIKIKLDFIDEIAIKLPVDFK